MKLIVGLGNPGKEYEKTRHNIGFLFLDQYLGEDTRWQKKMNAMYCEKIIANQKVIFLKPQTFMNLSGEAVRAFANYYKIPPEDILVISDDLDLSIGTYRLRSKGSSGGHNGLKNIEQQLNSDQYKRLRIGIMSDCYHENTISYVLGKFSHEEQEQLEKLFVQLKQCLDDYFILDFVTLMSHYNRRKKV